MPVKVLFPHGARFVICAWRVGEEEVTATEAFINSLIEAKNPDAESLLYELEKASNHGPSRNIEKFRYLSGTGQGLVEFKARGGSRVLGFVDSDRRRVICSHGIPKLKPKRFEREMEKAQGIRNTYLIESMEDGKYVN
jgi:hypothetical protein